MLERMLLRNLFGGRGHGNRVERNAVGIPFAHLLTEGQFDLLLTLLLAALSLNIVARSINAISSTSKGSFHHYSSRGDMRHVGISFAFAPVTSLCVLVLIYLHFEEDIRGKAMLKNWNRRYSFHPAKILFGQNQRYRLVTGQLIHGSKFHLYMNMASLAVMGHEEHQRTSSSSRGGASGADGDGATMPVLGFVCYFATLIVATGVAHVYLVKWFKPDNMYTYSVGFSGVLFALKTLANYNQTGLSSIGIPVFAEYWSLEIPIAVPIWSKHWCELFLISIIMPRASFWGHLAGIVTGYLFALVWNIKWVLSVIVQGKSATAKSNKAARRKKRNDDLDLRQNSNSGPIQDPLHPRWGRSHISQNCRKDFQTAYDLRDYSVDSLCSKWGNVLDLKRSPFRTPGSRFKDCMNNHFPSSTTEYSMDYIEDDDDYSAYSRPRHAHSDILTDSDLDAVTTIQKLNKKMLHQAKDCTLTAMQSHCEFREFLFIELFRANVTLHERLDQMAEVESKCKIEAEGNVQKIKASTTPDIVKEGGLLSLNSSQDDATKSFISPLSVSSTLRDKLKTRNPKSSNMKSSNIGEVFDECMGHLYTLEKAELGQRIGGDVTAWNNEEYLLMSHCAKQVTFKKCIGFSTLQADADSLSYNHVSILLSAVSSTDSQGNALKCMLQAVETDVRKFESARHGSSQSKSSNIEKEQGPRAIPAMNSGRKQPDTIQFLKENGMALVITVLILLLARRFIAQLAPKSDHHIERENDINTIGHTGNTKAWDEINSDAVGKDEDEEDLYADDSNGAKEDTVTDNETGDGHAEDGSSEAKEDSMSNDKESGDGDDNAGECDQKEADTTDVSQGFKDAFEVLVLTNDGQEHATVMKALKVIDKLVVNATTKGQDSADEESVKYRCIRAFNPSLKQYTELNGVLDVLVSLGFEQSPKEDESGAEILYLEFPMDFTGPIWMEEALRQMKEKRLQEGGLKKAGLARKQAANAALARFESSQAKKKLSKERSKSKKFAAGMGGGESSTLYYRGGT